jgi:O-antigen ligase
MFVVYSGILRFLFMILDRAVLERSAFYLACGCTVAGLFSIAISQILLGAAIVSLLAARVRWEMPPRVWMPLAFLVVWTLLSLALSSDPRAGFPQIKKFYVFLALPVVFTAVRGVPDYVRLVLLWGGVATGQALYSLGQYLWKWQQARAAGEDFYRAYMGRRITGTMSHWMTLGGIEMIVLLMFAAVLLFAARERVRWWMWAGAGLIAASIALGGTRSIWIGVAGGAAYLVARRRPKLLWAAPLVIGGALAFGPGFVRERALSLVRPHGTVDSNQHRVVTWRTGIEMVKDHPLVGLGPEMPGKLFDRYLPPDIPKPLPEGFYGHLHNLYLQYAAERGLPALAALLAFLGLTLANAFQAARRSGGDPRALLEGAVACVLAVMIAAVAEVNLGDSEVLLLFLAVVAAAYRAANYFTGAGAGGAATGGGATGAGVK